MKNILKKIKIDNTTYLLILLALLAGYFKNVSIILLIVIIHEFGHVFFFKIFNIEIQSIVVYPFGGITTVNKKIHERIYKDVIISLGGIIFQLILIIIFFIFNEYNLIVKSTYDLFLFYNYNIIFFNLIPIIPLDGSKLYFAIFSKYLSFKCSYIIMIILSFISLIFFGVYNFIHGLNDIIIYLFLIFKIYECIKEYRYVINKFYLERVMYNNYYDCIINNCSSLDKMMVNKYYFFKIGRRYINERDYILKNRY